MSQYVRLSNPEGMFVDADTGFSLWRDEVRPAGEALGGSTARDWLRDGGIIFCDKNGTPLAQQPYTPIPQEREVPLCLPSRIYNELRQLPGGLKANVSEAISNFKSVAADMRAY